MGRFLDTPDYEHGKPSATGVLLVNLGTPDAPTPRALRRYLGEFLWDPRVVEIPRPLWWLILHGVVLRFRPRASARAYATVWTGEGSPLLFHSRALARSVERQLASAYRHPPKVALAMRYGRPSVPAVLEDMHRTGVGRLLVLPLYPQYAAATTGSAFDAVTGVLSRWRRVPELRFINHYHDDPGYIAALAARVREYWRQHGRGDKLVMSFHGLPKRSLMLGDPYHCQSHKTARLLAGALELAPDQWMVTFQSRFGRQEWLKPYTDETMRALPGQGVKRVDVVCPGFAADCLETLEEIAGQNREFFLEAGGERFEYIPALNAEAEHVQALTALIRRELHGWELEEADFEEAAAGAELARAMGATR